jgi:Regulator of polyketide synthase expression
MKTLNDILTSPRFSSLTLLTDKTCANTKIETIDITETPDIAHYIPEQTFVLTTAMIYQHQQKKLIDLIDSLKAKNAAGLGIKIGRFIDVIDPSVIAYANQVQLPLVQIPATIPLGNLLHQLLNLLWNTKTEQLNYALDIQKRFSEMIVNDASVEQFIYSFGSFINTPIVLTGSYKNVIAQSHHFTNIATPAAYYVKQLNKQQLWPDNHLTASCLLEDANHNKIQAFVYPVEAKGYFPHYLIILNPGKIPYPISDFAIDQAKLVLSFMLYKNQKVKESLNYLKQDFFTRMIEYQQSTVQKERDWLDLGANHGLVNARHYRIVYIACRHTEKEAEKIRYQEEEARIAFDWLEEALMYQIKDMSLFQISESNHFALLIQHRLDNLEEILLQAAEQLQEVTNIKLIFGIGTIYDTIHQVAKSFVEAKDAFNSLFIHAKAYTGSISYYKPKGTRSLFEKINPTDIHYFCERTLGRLAYPKDDSLIELRKTLKCYLDSQCNIAQTAKELFVHRNTIKYRIERCENILETNIHDSEANLDMRLALELSEKTHE